jgi:hypothetical protein
VVLEILQIDGYPAAVDQDATLLTLFIKVGVERCNNFDTVLTIAELFNLNLSVVIEDASDLNLLEGVVTLELIDISGFSPWEAALVLRGNVDGSLSEQ